MGEGAKPPLQPQWQVASAAVEVGGVGLALKAAGRPASGLWTKAALVKDCPTDWQPVMAQILPDVRVGDSFDASHCMHAFITWPPPADQSQQATPMTSMAFPAA